MGGLNEAALHMVATYLSLLLWGLYVCLFLRLMWVLRVRSVSLLSPPIVIIFVVFIFSVGQTVIIVYLAQYGFAKYPDGPTAYFTLYDSMLIGQGWTTATDFLQCAAGFTVNVIMTWRLFVIWSRERRVIYFPILLQCSGVAASIIIICDDIIDIKQLVRSSNFLTRYHENHLELLAINIVITWYCTGLICYRLWSMQQQKRAIAAEAYNFGSEFESRNPYAGVMWALIHNGMLYGLSQAAHLVCSAMQNHAGKLILRELNINIIGIVTVLIMLELDVRDASEVMIAGHQPSPLEASGISMPVFRVLTPSDPEVVEGMKAAES
ncbi:hypothetical protein FRB96_007388 [Tulasnella sp. 330]|nr:hypothetical protein FRB96_007388 [Tulasnella sp. 330]